MVSESQECGCFLCREVEDPLFFEPPSRGLPGIEKGALIEIVDCPILPVDGGKNCVTRSKETPGHLSNWTLPSSACATFRDISSE